MRITDRPRPMRLGRWSGLTERRLTLTRLPGHSVDGSGARSDPDPNHEGTAMMKPTGMTRTTDEIIDRFNRRSRNATPPSSTTLSPPTA